MILEEQTEISIHALLAESDYSLPALTLIVRHFYPRSPCGERLNSAYGALDGASISIHALLAESDQNARPETRQLDVISIHALLAESDPPRVIREPTATGFLSTLSLRRATRCK